MESGVAEGRGAALAFGSGYVHRGNAPVGGSHSLQERLHPPQVIDDLLTRPSNLGPFRIEQGQDVCDGLVVLHRAPRTRFRQICLIEPFRPGRA